jgi:hypothetical protein
MRGRHRHSAAHALHFRESFASHSCLPISRASHLRSRGASAPYRSRSTSSESFADALGSGFARRSSRCGALTRGMGHRLPLFGFSTTKTALHLASQNARGVGRRSDGAFGVVEHDEQSPERDFGELRRVGVGGVHAPSLHRDFRGGPFRKRSAARNRNAVEFAAFPLAGFFLSAVIPQLAEACFSSSLRTREAGEAPTTCGTRMTSLLRHSPVQSRWHILGPSFSRATGRCSRLSR